MIKLPVVKSATNEFQKVYENLCGILVKHQKSLDLARNEGWEYSTNVKGKAYRGRPLWFAGIRIGKGYVSYHLMPVYMNPKMQTMISPELKKRMQGKACFNFKTVDKPLFKELEKL